MVRCQDRPHSLSEGVFMDADEASPVEGAERMLPTVIVADLRLHSADRDS